VYYHRKLNIFRENTMRKNIYSLITILAFSFPMNACAKKKEKEGMDPVAALVLTSSATGTGNRNRNISSVYTNRFICYSRNSKNDHILKFCHGCYLL